MATEKPGPDRCDDARDRSDDARELPITGELDLHLFHPREVSSLVDEYLRECRRRGILEVRIVHGKGRGVLLQTVHATLQRIDFVSDFSVDWGSRGSWGATRAYLQPASGE